MVALLPKEEAMCEIDNFLFQSMRRNASSTLVIIFWPGPKYKDLAF